MMLTLPRRAPRYFAFHAIIAIDAVFAAFAMMAILFSPALIQSRRCRRFHFHC